MRVREAAGRARMDPHEPPPGASDGKCRLLPMECACNLFVTTGFVVSLLVSSAVTNLKCAHATLPRAPGGSQPWRGAPAAAFGVRALRVGRRKPRRSGELQDSDRAATRIGRPGRGSVHSARAAPAGKGWPGLSRSGPGPAHSGPSLPLREATGPYSAPQARRRAPREHHRGRPGTGALVCVLRPAPSISPPRLAKLASGVQTRLRRSSQVSRPAPAAKPKQILAPSRLCVWRTRALVD